MNADSFVGPFDLSNKTQQDKLQESFGNAYSKAQHIP